MSAALICIKNATIIDELTVEVISLSESSINEKLMSPAEHLLDNMNPLLLHKTEVIPIASHAYVNGDFVFFH